MQSLRLDEISEDFAKVSGDILVVLKEEGYGYAYAYYWDRYGKWFLDDDVVLHQTPIRFYKITLF